MANRENSVSVDRLSAFPDDILCHVLSFLSTKNSVRTSILSSRWRHLFASMSTLDFSDLTFMDVDIENQFKNFVDRFLFLSNLESLECFKMTKDSSWSYDYESFYAWICVALCLGVKELVLEYFDFLSLPSKLFTSDSLVTLKLVYTGKYTVPADACLPNLKTLHLQGFVYSDISVSIFRLVSSCLVLEELLLEPVPDEIIGSDVDISNPSLKRLYLRLGSLYVFRCQKLNYVVKINAPNLVSFEYVDILTDGYTLSHVPCLEKATIHFLPHYLTYNLDYERAATQLLQAICNVRSLDLSIQLVGPVFPTGLLPMLSFPDLVELDFSTCFSGWQGTWLVEFLHCVPRLERLAFEMPSSLPEDIRPLPSTVPSCLLFHLKEIKIKLCRDGQMSDLFSDHFFDETEHVFELICYFFKQALVLEKLVINVPFRDQDGQQSSLIEKILSLSKESKKCQIVIL